MIGFNLKYCTYVPYVHIAVRLTLSFAGICYNIWLFLFVFASKLFHCSCNATVKFWQQESIYSSHICTSAHLSPAFYGSFV